MARLGLCLICLFFPAWCRAQAVGSQAIDALVKDTLKQYAFLGLALAIVHEDRVWCISKATGSGKWASALTSVTAGIPIFPIASCTKPFTSLAVGMLVSDGKMSWDDRVKRHVPFFHLSDPLADANVTLRDLLAHRTGVGSHDLLWYKAPWDLEERIRKIGTVALEDSFRSRFHYQAILFGTAGYAAGKAAGSDWREVVQKRILDPLGMKASCPVFPGGAAELAMPHRHNAQGNIEPLARYPLDKRLTRRGPCTLRCPQPVPVSPRFELGDGTWQGKRLSSAQTNSARGTNPRWSFPATVSPRS